MVEYIEELDQWFRVSIKQGLPYVRRDQACHDDNRYGLKRRGRTQTNPQVWRNPPTLSDEEETPLRPPIVQETDEGPVKNTQDTQHAHVAPIDLTITAQGIVNLGAEEDELEYETPLRTAPLPLQEP